MSVSQQAPDNHSQSGTRNEQDRLIRKRQLNRLHEAEQEHYGDFKSFDEYGHTIPEIMGDDTPRQRLRIGLPSEYTTPRGEPIKPKVGSLENKDYKPSGGEEKIFSEKVKVNAESKVSSKANIDHTPGGGNKKIFSEKVDYTSKTASKVGSMEKKDYKPGGGDKKYVIDENLQWNAKAKLDTRENINYKVPESQVKVFEEKVEFSKNAKPKVQSFENKDYQPQPSNIKIYEEKLPWLEHNRPKVRPMRDDESPGQFDRTRALEYDKKVKETAEVSPAKVRPRQFPNERESTNSPPRYDRRRQLAYNPNQNTGSTTRATARDTQNHSDTVKAGNSTSNQKTSGQPKKSEEKTAKPAERRAQNTRKAQETHRVDMPKTKKPATQRESRRDQHESSSNFRKPVTETTSTPRPKHHQAEVKKTHVEKQQAVKKPPPQEEKEKLSQPQKVQVKEDDLIRQERGSNAVPKTEKKQASAVEKPKDVKLHVEKPSVTVREADSWEYARHEYERPPVASPKKTPARSLDDDYKENSPPPHDSVSEKELKMEAPSRGVRDLYKTEGYAKRHEIAPTAAPNISLMLQPLGSNYRHDWKTKAEVRVKLDEEGKLVLKTNNPPETKLPRVANYDENFALPNYSNQQLPIKQRSHSEPKPKKITGASLENILPKAEKLLDVPASPSKHYSQYHVAKGKKVDKTYSENMQKERLKQARQEKEKGKVYLDSNDYMNNFYTEVRLNNSESLHEPDVARGRHYASSGGGAIKANTDEDTADFEQRLQEEDLYDNLMVRSQPDYQQYFEEEIPIDATHPHHSQLPPIFSDRDMQSITTSQEQRRKKKFVYWRPGEQPFSNPNTSENLSYAQKMALERQKRSQKKGFADLHNQKKFWFDDYNQKMVERYGKVEKVSQKDLMHSTYELY